jgi:hypothetical protein
MPKTYVGFRLDDDVYDQIIKLAGTGRTITDVCKQAISDFLANPDRRMPPPHCPHAEHQGKMISLGWWCHNCARLYR